MCKDLKGKPLDYISVERQPDKIFANKVGRYWGILRSEVDNFLLREKDSAYQMSINSNTKNNSL